MTRRCEEDFWAGKPPSLGLPKDLCLGQLGASLLVPGHWTDGLSSCILLLICGCASKSEISFEIRSPPLPTRPFLLQHYFHPQVRRKHSTTWLAGSSTARKETVGEEIKAIWGEGNRCLGDEKQKLVQTEWMSDGPSRGKTQWKQQEEFMKVRGKEKKEGCGTKGDSQKWQQKVLKTKFEQNVSGTREMENKGYWKDEDAQSSYCGERASRVRICVLNTMLSYSRTDGHTGGVLGNFVQVARRSFVQRISAGREH